MLHDKLSFRSDRCDHDTLTHPEPKQPFSKQPSPPIRQILKRPCPMLEMSRESVPLTPTLTSTKKVRKPKKKRKKGKGARIIEKPLDESKPLSIAMIGAAVYRSLIQKKDVKTFSLTLCQINQMLNSLNSQNNNSTLYAINPAIIEEIRAKLPLEYHEFLDVFNRSKTDKLLSHRPYDHKIKLKRERQPPKNRLYFMSGYKLQKVKEYLIKNLKKGFITSNKALYASPILFTKKKDGDLRFYMDYRRLNALIKRDRYPISLIEKVLARV
jgi:hypothetical protein